MKTIKNDTRYIIKRVLIGVLVAILLFNARKCGVYAETIDFYLQNSSYCNSINRPSTDASCRNFTFDKQISSTFSDYNVNFFIRVNQSPAPTNLYYFIIKNNNNSDILLFSTILSKDDAFINTLDFNINSSADYRRELYLNNNLWGYTGSGSGFDFIYLSETENNIKSFSNSVNSNYFTYSYNSSYNLYYSRMTSNAYGYSNVTQAIYNLLSSGNWSLLDTNLKDITYDKNIVPPAPTFPPSGYSELSLKDYQGVVFVPKDYDNITCSVVGDLCNATFNYYYQEEIKEAYFPIDNRFNIRFNSDFLNSPNEPSDLKSTYFPISQVSSNETFYYAFMIYNYTNDGSPLDPNTYYAYGDAKVWYDSTLWNYYLVDDFNTWSANVCYIVNGSEVCTTISGLPTLKEAIEQAQLEQNLLGTHVGDLNLFTSLIRFPLGFVQSLSSDTCTPIQLPSLPFIGGDISLPCMSLIYQQVLGIYQPVISGFINFVIIYYLILALIKFYNKTFDPSHTEIEVIDL